MRDLLEAIFGRFRGGGPVDDLEIVISAQGDRVWINLAGVCVGRWCRVKNLTVDDRRRQLKQVLP